MVSKLLFRKYMFLSFRLLADNLAHCHLLPTWHWWNLGHCSEGKGTMHGYVNKIIKTYLVIEKMKSLHTIQAYIEKVFYQATFFNNNGFFQITFLVNYFCFFICLYFFDICFQEKMYLRTMTIKQQTESTLIILYEHLLINCSIPHFDGQLPGYAQ